MPYDKIEELPDNVKTLPSEAQTLWKNVFNRNYKQYGEDVARRIAWTIVKKSYEKDEEGKWVKI